jgi:hypothetical protein
MNDFFTFIVGLAMFIGIMWLLLRAGLLEKTPIDQDEDGAQSERDVRHIVQASRPAPLDADDRLEELRTYTQRPHIKAGTAWGQEL